MASKNTKIINPKTGLLEFGYLHEIIIPTQSLHIEAGHIYLRHGDKAFGANHIWNKHGSALKKIGYLMLDDVAKYVSDIIVPGARIHIEDKRPMILKSSKGIVILQLKCVESINEYSVVSAYRAGYAHGPLVGTIKKTEL